MNQNNTRLTEEITKLIVALLTKDGGVYLPSIGSLTLRGEQTGRSVTFSEEEQHGSIVGVIASRGNCSAEKAQKIYDKWLSITRSESGDVEIYNVGKIEGGVFTISKVLADRLSPAVPKVTPKVSKPKSKSKRSGSSSMPLVIGGVVVAALVALVLLIGGRSGGDVESVEPQSVVAEVVVEPCEAEAVVVDQVEIVEDVKVAEPSKPRYHKLTSKARFVDNERAQAVLSERLLSSSDSPLRFRVVCGVLLSPSNAGRLILDIEARTDFEVKAYERSGGYMITLFESEGFRASVNFIKAHASKYYDYTWVYDEKTM